jgi:hypothetical protein
MEAKLDIPEMQNGEDGATEKQKGFIRALMHDVGASGFPEATLQDLGKWQASSIIDQLQSIKKQMAGDKPLDTTTYTDLNAPSEGRSKLLYWGLAILFIIMLIGWLGD